MRILCGWDDTVVVARGRAYADTTTPFEYLPGALAGLWSLKRAGHDLMLWSFRDAPRLLKQSADYGPMRSPPAMLDMNVARKAAMDAAIARDLPTIFVQPGLNQAEGKPSVDKIIDDKSIPAPWPWYAISGVYGASLAVGLKCSVLFGDDRLPAEITGVPGPFGEDENALYDLLVTEKPGTVTRGHFPWAHIVAPLP